MRKLLLIISLLFISSLASTASLDELQTMWESWKTLYSKSYTEAEEATRFEIFKENYKKVVEFNEENADSKIGLNKFADLTSEEFKNRYLLHSQEAKVPNTASEEPAIELGSADL